MKTLPFSLILVLFFLLIKICPAFSQQITFHKVAPPIGDFSGLVGGITQDKNGYMWIATGGGLYRYDGYRFKFYSNYRSDTSSSSSRRLETVYADRKGFIWIATWIDGMDRLDPLTGKFTHFQHDPNDVASLANDTVRTFLEDRDGILWIGTSGGLGKYDPQTGKFQNYYHDPNDPYSLSCNRVRKLYEDRQGTLWIGTGSVWNGEGGETDEGGLNRFDKKTEKFISYKHDPNNPHSLVNNKVQSICEDSKGRFWIGTARDGLHTMDRATGMFERHLYDAARPEKLSRPPIKNVSGPDHITFINEDSLGGIWIGTFGNGINYYDSKTGKMIHCGTESGAAGFTDNSGGSFCISRDGVIWIGTWQGGLFRLDPFHKNIPHFILGNSVGAFNEDPVNGFWIGTTEGLIFQNKTNNTSKRFVHSDRDPASISNNYVLSMFRDSKGGLWIGTANGLNRFYAPSNGFTRYEHNPEDPNSIAAGSIYALVDACGDSLWIGTTTGLDLMNKKTGTFTHFKYNPKDIHVSRGVSALANDKSGNLWIGRYPGGGVNHFDCKTKTFKHFLKGLSVYSLHAGTDGTLWVGTEGDGIYRSNSSGSEFTKFTDPGSGIENASVSSIQQDAQNNLWLRTNHGIYKIDARTSQSKVFGKNYGVTFDNINLLAGHKGMHGEIYFGNLDGYYVISPEELFSNPIPPQIALTDFRVGGMSLIFDGNLLDTSLETIKKISLRHDQNVISFEFAGIHYSDPAGNRHLYMLENYDQAWREAGAEKAAHYFNVPPGHYVFKVKAASSEGLWAERTVDIVIAPPWWRTWWAYCIYGLLFISFVYFIHRVQKQRVISKERERARVYELAQAKEIEKAYKELGIKSAELEEQKEELQATLENLKTTQGQLIQSEKMASLGELTAGIAHEIQNPLNFVNNFSEVNKELLTEMKDEIDKGNLDEVKTIANDVIENQEKINQHGKRADAIVKGMLQHSRTSSGQKEPTDINALADEYLRLAYHGLRAKDKSFNAKFETDFHPSLEKINVIPQDIGRVILNLINNAFYSISEKQKQDIAGYEPTLIVATRKVNDKIEIRIKDNGNGIPQKALDKIFQPFFTTKPAGQGTGLGLSLAYDIITKGHNGELKVENRQQQGAVFIIILPVV